MATRDFPVLANVAKKVVSVINSPVLVSQTPNSDKHPIA